MQLRIENLSAGYASKPVLRDINLQANSGDFIVMIGKNGAGKSTLIKSIGGIIPALQGNIIINDKSLTELPPEKRARYLGMVLTDRIDIPLSVYEFAALGRQAFTGYFDILSQADKNVINNVIQQLNLQKYIRKNINELSDGERQKVLIARVLVQETPIVLLDEPTAHLDLENKAMIFSLLKELAQKLNKIVIVSTHDINLVLKLVHKLWLVDKQNVLEINKNSEELFQLFNSKKIQYDNDCKVFRII